MRLREIIMSEDATAGATTSADIATVAYPLFVKGKTRKERRRNARAAVGQGEGVSPLLIRRVYEASLSAMRDYYAGKEDSDEEEWKPTSLTKMRNFFNQVKTPSDIQRIFQKIQHNEKISGEEFRKYKNWVDTHRQTQEAHTLSSDSVIYRLDREDPMNATEVLVLGGAGRYSLKGLREKARREAAALSKGLEAEHGGSFRGAAHNIKQLTNTLNTIVTAYNELKRIRGKGGRGSRGITDEDSNFIRECLTVLDEACSKRKKLK